MRMPMPRLQDGTPDSGTEKLETPEANTVSKWLNHHTEHSNIAFVETRNGINVYRVINPEAFSD